MIKLKPVLLVVATLAIAAAGAVAQATSEPEAPAVSLTQSDD